ncbi:MAG: PilZ domain-containing protein [bacterium]|nr:PilZ domain-containing protein [bacterium]
MSEPTPDSEAAVVADLERAKQEHRRVSVRVPIRISTIDPDKDPKTGKLYFFTSEELSANISRGGAFVATPEDIDPGRRVLVEIDIPNGSNIQTLGRVVWKRVGTGAGQAETSPRARSGIGIQFMGGRPELLNELDRYITATSRRRPASNELGTANQPQT